MKKYILFLAIGVFTIACNQEDNEVEQRLEQIEEAEAKWNARKTPDYNFTYRASCFCIFTDPVIVRVNADTVNAVLDTETMELKRIFWNGDSVYVLQEFPESFITIDAFFEKLKEDALEADELTMSFDSNEGYPKEVSIDYIFEAADDEISYTFQKVQFTTLSSSGNE